MAAILANYNLISWCQKRDILGFPTERWSDRCFQDVPWVASSMENDEDSKRVKPRGQCLFLLSVFCSQLAPKPRIYISAWCLKFLGILSGYSVTRDFHQGSTAPRPSSHALRPLQWGPGYEKHQTGIPATADFHREKSGKWLVHVGSKVLNHWILRCPNFQTKA